MLVYLPVWHCAVTPGWRLHAKSIAGRLQVPFLDATEMLAGLSHEEMGRLFIAEGDVPYIGGQGHYNREGNDLLARWLHDRLAAIQPVAAALQRARP